MGTISSSIETFFLKVSDSSDFAETFLYAGKILFRMSLCLDDIDLTEQVEIGNEQGLDAALAAQFTSIANAMDSRAKQLRLPFNFSFVFGPRPDLSPQVSDSISPTHLLYISRDVSRRLDTRNRCVRGIGAVIGATPASLL